MVDDANYRDILEENVRDAKDSIRELEDPDYERLLELEAEGMNRKTMRQWLEKQLEDQEYEVGREDAVDEMFLSSITPGSALVGGLVIGLVVGMVAMSYGPLDGSTGATPSQVEQAVQEYADSVSRTGRVESAEVESVTRRNGMYFANITVEASLLNTTRTSQAGMYVSPDGQVLFPTAIDIDQAVQQMQQPGPVNGTAS